MHCACAGPSFEVTIGESRSPDYAGPLRVIQPYYLPALRCTPDHRVFATLDPTRPPERLEARGLTARHYLAIPRHYEFSSPQQVDVRAALSSHSTSFRTPHQLSDASVERIMAASAEGASSRELGREFGKDPSYIRHVRSKVRRGMWQTSRTAELVSENGRLRFSKERRPGIPRVIAVDETFARLLGFYCAEGSVQRDKDRPNSHVAVFAFGLHEVGLAEETRQLIRGIFGLPAALTRRRTTLAVTLNKSSAALLIKYLCGATSGEKRVPQVLWDAPRPAVEAFLEAYVRGDGHRFANGKVSVTTISRDLAFGVAWLALKTGHLASLYENRLPPEKTIEGRRVRQAPIQYSVVWYENESVERKYLTTEGFYLVPIRDVTEVEFDGNVFNLEVEDEHNYLANFLLVSNCQNWVTSQALRDPASEMYGAEPMVVTPQKLVAAAKEKGAGLVGSSYNEPLITSEWATAVFKEAVQAGLKCVYISNGNATRETLEYIRPYVTGYKIDLKSMSKKGYQQLGGVLENTLNGIRMVHEMGFWLEVVTLVIPGFNDSAEELWDAARFLAGLSPDIPWHVTAFHKDYKMTDPDNTTARHLLRAAEIGQEAGLRYVYAGNLPGQVGDYEHTFCHNCHAKLIERYGYIVTDYRITAQGTCPECGTRIPGVWSEQPETVRRRGPGRPRRVRDRR